MESSSAQPPLHVVILAAGKGTRMGDPDRPKVLTLLLDRPLLDYVLHQANALHPNTTIVIVGHRRESVEQFVQQHHSFAACVTQHNQLGTGHAVLQTAPLLEHQDGDVLILSGDVPLLSVDTLSTFIQEHRAAHAALSVLTTTVDNPAGYGRIVRNSDGSFLRIVEQKDANDAQQNIAEINSGVYLARTNQLFSALRKVTNTNNQGEYYLTDIVHILLETQQSVVAVHTSHAIEVHGINSPADLESARKILSEQGAST